MCYNTSLSEYILFSSKRALFPKSKIAHKNHKHSPKEDVDVKGEMWLALLGGKSQHSLLCHLDSWHSSHLYLISISPDKLFTLEECNGTPLCLCICSCILLSEITRVGGWGESSDFCQWDPFYTQFALLYTALVSPCDTGIFDTPLTWVSLKGKFRVVVMLQSM